MTLLAGRPIISLSEKSRMVHLPGKMAGKMIDYFVCPVQHLGSYVHPFQTGLNIKMYTSLPLYYHSTNSLKELKGIKSTYPKFPTRKTTVWPHPTHHCMSNCIYEGSLMLVLHCIHRQQQQESFNCLFSRTTQVGRYRKDKPFWIFLKQR